MSTLFASYTYCFCLILCYGPTYTTASDELSALSEKCEKVHRTPSSTDYGCGGCKVGFEENANSVCVSECPTDLECASRHRMACSERTNGLCGACIQSYIDLAGYCITEEKAAEAIKILEELLAVRQAKGSGSSATGSGATGSSATGSSAVKKFEKTADAEAVPSTPQPTSKSSGVAAVAASKRVASEDDMSDPAVVDLSVAESDGASVGFSKLLFFCIIAGATLVCIVSLLIAAICWYRLHKVRKSMQPSEYVGGAESHGKDSMTRSDSTGDRKLAHSAQMYLYQHHKQQMLALESSLSDRQDDSDGEESEENEDGNYTVYECPGLAPAGEMEVSNPLFQATAKASPSTSPADTPASMPSPQQSTMSTSQEADDSTHD